jgi:superfamily II DNA/RNA helicase
MKHVAKRIAEKLERGGFRATSLHGNLSQNRRKESLEGFKTGRYSVMVATDIAARGIDVEGVSHVINFDMPDTLENYIHRTGRAGRAERTGEAISFVTAEDMGLLRSIERYIGSPMKVLGRHRSTRDQQAEATSRPPMTRPRQGNSGGRQGQGAGRNQRGGPRGDRSGPGARSGQGQGRATPQSRY